MTEGDYGVTFHGPFVRDEAYRMTVQGYQVPHIEAYLRPGTEDTWVLVLDRRMGTEDVPGDEVRRWLPFLANCMAFAAGYPCHGAAEKFNPFRVGMIGIAPAEDGTFAKDDDDWTLPGEVQG